MTPRTRHLASLTAVSGFVIHLAGCADGLSPPVAFKQESVHFLFVSTTDHATETEMTAGLSLAEGLFSDISAFVGPDHVPTERIRVVLEGDQTTRGSYVDFDGVHLFRYPPEDGGYWAVLAHELVHAFGVEWFIAHATWDWPTYGFFDEGFAEYVAQEVDPNKKGFPFFGYPEDVVAGSWMMSPGAWIPLPTLRLQHTPLNDSCNLQAYTLRASWFRYVGEALGREAVLRIAYPDVEPTSEVVQALTGRTLEELDAEWEAWIRIRYSESPNADSLAASYATRTPWYQACIAGTDY